MPDLIGVNGDRAADVLRDARLPRRRSSADHPYPGVAAGIVILRQSPQAGSRSRPARPISLEVSR